MALATKVGVSLYGIIFANGSTAVVNLFIVESTYKSKINIFVVSNGKSRCCTIEYVYGILEIWTDYPPSS